MKLPLLDYPKGYHSYTVGLESIEITNLGKLAPTLYSTVYFNTLRSKRNWSPIQLRPNAHVIDSNKNGARRKPIVPVLFDSGTTLSYFFPRLFRDILQSIELRVGYNARNRMRSLSSSNKGNTATHKPEKVFSTDEGPAIIREKFLSRKEKKDNRIQYIPIQNELLTETPKRLVKLSSIPLEIKSRQLKQTIYSHLSRIASENGRELHEGDSSWYAVIEPRYTEDSNGEKILEAVENKNSENEKQETENNSNEILIGFVDIPKSMEGAPPRVLVTKVESYSNGECWWLQNKAKDLELFPMLRFKFFGSNSYVGWHPMSYLYKSNDDHFWCFGVMTDLFSEDIENSYDNETIFGSNAFIYKEIGFHIESDDFTTLSGDYEGADDLNYYVNENAWLSITDSMCKEIDFDK